MLKREITYTNFDDVEVSEIYHFNFSKAEIIELEVQFEGGLSGLLTRIVEAKDNKQIVEQLKRFILLAYGKKSEDGKRFVKSEQLREEFSQTAAYDALFIELASDADKAADWVLGVFPKDLRESAEAAEALAKVKSA